METTSNSLTFKHISIATDDIVSYINNRRLGVSRSLKTKWKKFNDSCNGGLEPNVVVTACGISGAGDKYLLILM